MIDNFTKQVAAIKFRILYFCILIVAGVFITPLWPAFLIVWLSISLYWDYTGQSLQLTKDEHKVYNFLIYLYPLIGTLIKVFILTKYFTSIYFWLNRIEHAMWAMALVILLWPAWKSLQKKVGSIALVIIIFSVVCLFGNMVEIVEFGFRYFRTISDSSVFYYTDTLFDIISNFFGAGLGILVILKSVKPKLLTK